MVIEGALAAEAAVLRDFVAAQLRVHGSTRGRYVLPATLRAALPPPPTLNIPVSTRASSSLRGDFLPPNAPRRTLEVPALLAGGAAADAPLAALTLTVPAVATAPIGRQHVAPPASRVSAAAEEKKGEEGDASPAQQRSGGGARGQRAPPPPAPTAAAVRAAVAAAEAERLQAAAAAGLLPPPPPPRLRRSPARPPPPAAAAGAPPFTLPPLPPPPRLSAYATPGDVLEATLAEQSPGALLEGYVVAGRVGIGGGGGDARGASSELLAAAAGNAAASVDHMGVPRIGEVGDRRALALAGVPVAGSPVAPLPPRPPYALRAAPLAARFGELPSHGKETALEVLLSNVGAGKEPLRFRITDRALLGPHAKAGNSVRVRHEGGPLAFGAQRPLTISIVPREAGEVALLLRVVAEGLETLDIPVTARVLPS